MKEKTMRITGGSLVRRRFLVPKEADANLVRPTPDRVREAVFSMLGDLRGKRVLDLFAGSGAHGYEAISRGAAQVRFVEINREVRKVIEENIRALDLGDKASVTLADALQFVQDPPKNDWDIVFVDPPYRIEPDERFWNALEKHVAPEGMVVFRSFPKNPPPFPKVFEIWRDRTYAGTRVFVLKRVEAV